MDKTVESALIFEDYSINSMEFERNYDYVGPDEIELTFGFESSVRFTDNKDKAKLKISCKIFEEELKQSAAPFHLSMSMTGRFSCEGEVDIEDFQMNGMAILLPYLRAVITSFTSQAGISPVILPPINVYKVFKLEKED